MDVTAERGDGDTALWDPSQCVGTPYCPPRCPRFVDKHGIGLVVRTYVSDDWERLREMYLSYGTEHRSLGLPPTGAARIDEWLEGLVERGRNYVAVDGKEVVGHATYAPRDDPEPELAVFVHPDSHDRGIGTELCRHVVADAESNGHDALVLHVAPENRRAIHVYLGLGFEVVPSESSETKMRLSFDAVDIPTTGKPADASRE
ncbi:N-acetyltransferase GCN5 [Haloferax larsenii JCM 13917]|nr:GNAT family N-acetyltransferase [Haloferax larsenii]ELZ80840.1 N-acetyltransferase GCN5 [Haloferax larsenii JCM 13917]